LEKILVDLKVFAKKENFDFIRFNSAVENKLINKNNFKKL
jgi:hypothetical protein